MSLWSLTNWRTLHQLKSTETHQRALAIDRLADLRNPKACPWLVRELPKRITGYQAARALELLNWAPSSDAERVRFYIAGEHWDRIREWIERDGLQVVTMQPFTDELTHGPSHIRCKLIELSAVAPSTEAAALIIASLESRPVRDWTCEENFSLLRSAEHALIAIGAVAVSVLLDAIGSSDLEIQATAVRALGRLRATEASSALMQLFERLLNRPQWRPLGEIAEALAEIGDTRFVPQLEAAAHKVGDRWLRVTFASALNDLGAKMPAFDVALDVLRQAEALETPDGRHGGAALVLGRVGDERAVTLPHGRS